MNLNLCKLCDIERAGEWVRKEIFCVTPKGPYRSKITNLYAILHLTNGKKYFKFMKESIKRSILGNFLRVNIAELKI